MLGPFRKWHCPGAPTRKRHFARWIRHPLGRRNTDEYATSNSVRQLAVQAPVFAQALLGLPAPNHLRELHTVRRGQFGELSVSRNHNDSPARRQRPVEVFRRIHVGRSVPRYRPKRDRVRSREAIRIMMRYMDEQSELRLFRQKLALERSQHLAATFQPVARKLSALASLLYGLVTWAFHLGAFLIFTIVLAGVANPSILALIWIVST